MTIALVSHVGGSTIGGTTSGIVTTGANFLVAVLGTSGVNGTPTIADSYSNTWNPLTLYQGANGAAANLIIYYAWNATCGIGHTFTESGNAGGMCVAAFSGVQTSVDPLDQQNGDGEYNNGLGSIQPGSVTPTVNNELLITGVNDGLTPTVDSSFTTTDVGQGSAFFISMAYLIQTTATAKNPTWSIGGLVQGTAANIATFKASTGGGAAFVPNLPLIVKGAVPRASNY